MVWISQIRVDARDSLIPWSTVRSLYERHRIVHVKRAALGRHRPTRWLGEVKRLAKTHNATTVSREGGAAFESEEPWYASFVVHDATACAALCAEAAPLHPVGGLCYWSRRHAGRGAEAARRLDQPAEQREALLLDLVREVAAVGLRVRLVRDRDVLLAEAGGDEAARDANVLIKQGRFFDWRDTATQGAAVGRLVSCLSLIHI